MIHRQKSGQIWSARAFRRGIHTPRVAQQKLRILCYWVEKCTFMGLAVTLSLWTMKMKAIDDEKDS
jgi:hypothetical protein